LVKSKEALYSNSKVLFVSCYHAEIKNKERKRIGSIHQHSWQKQTGLNSMDFTCHGTI
jgi:hypothetical protein